MYTWYTPYIGFPNRLKSGQCLAFTSDRWKKLNNLNDIELRNPDVQSQCSLGADEHLHEPLWRLYRKISNYYGNVNHHLILKTVVKAVSGTITKNKLVRTQLLWINSNVSNNKQ